MSQPLQALLLEDRETDAELVIRELRRAGFTGDWPRVQTEGDFLAHLHDGLEVILADYDMPQFSALRALELLRERGSNIPLIIVSGTIGEETAVAAMREGAVDYLLKDRMGRLGASVRTALHLKAVRDEKRSMAEALQESETRFRQLAEAIPDVFWLSDPETRQMLYVSPAYEHIWGRDRESLYAAPRSFAEAIHPEDRQRVEEALQSNREKGGRLELDYRIIRPDSTIRWIHVSGFPVHGPDGTLHRVAGVARDITHQRDLEAQLLQAQKMEAVGRLAGGVAHDFNNILTVINGYGESLLHTLPAQDSRREMVDEICGAGRRAAALTRQLLAFSRKQILDVKLVDLNSILRDMEGMLRRLLGEHVDLKLTLAADLGRVRADPSQLEQVVMNLAVNASDAMPEGGRLHLSTQNVQSTDPLMASIPHVAAADFVMLSVQDTGMGMSAEVQAHIYEPFFTTKPEGKGTGLGLATCFGIVQQSGGHIAVESRLNEGATFRIFLPVSSVGVVDRRRIPLSHAPRGSETILLVEDNAPVRDLTAKLLRKNGYEVLEASDGEAGHKLALERGGQFDLLLTDAVMPRMSGKELVARVSRQWPHIKAVLCSGYVQDEPAITSTLQAGLAFLSKPFTPAELLQKVRAVLDAK
ncbi:MAG TPA: response regulator [Kiritimatiellia bacterium]|nr:response regulator [Kiritimatiellia bacterium]